MKIYWIALLPLLTGCVTISNTCKPQRITVEVIIPPSVHTTIPVSQPIVTVKSTAPLKTTIITQPRCKLLTELLQTPPLDVTPYLSATATPYELIGFLLTRTKVVDIAIRDIRKTCH